MLKAFICQTLRTVEVERSDSLQSRDDFEIVVADKIRRVDACKSQLPDNRTDVFPVFARHRLARLNAIVGPINAVEGRLRAQDERRRMPVNELRPTLETVLTSKYELRVCQNRIGNVWFVFAYSFSSRRIAVT